ncbi:XRE family transcriptional regulator [Parahaliea maris]|uniref:XRE family transcriptional regulator n=1 Tax=Parahaliea maris TaxID=2716870 RepID=A0A5C9A095_9GAMM|nr:XRE family transcriptional regulator [Parahaliea maris]TXS94186.1 XRE family transcriptional regulator [Parahaliea maris]
MAQVTALVEALKSALKSAGITYAGVAAALALSESSVKRKFSREEFTLAEIDRICSLCALDISALVQLMEQRHDRLQRLSVEQEREIADDLALLVVTVCVLNHWRFEDILRFYVFEEHQLVQMLARLDRLRLIELQPNNRIKLLVATNFGWRPGGPIQTRFLKTIQKDFFAANFDRQDHSLIVLNGMLSEESNSEFRRKLERLAREFDQLNREDAGLPFTDRHGYTAVMALRDWRYTGFAPLLKDAT